MEPTSVRTIEPVGHASRQPDSSQGLQTPREKSSETGLPPSPIIDCRSSLEAVTAIEPVLLTAALRHCLASFKWFVEQQPATQCHSPYRRCISRYISVTPHRVQGDEWLRVTCFLDRLQRLVIYSDGAVHEAILLC